MNNLIFRKLKKSDDLSEAAKLILSHDLDYHYLIGEYEENLDVLLSLMNDQDSIFYYNNYHVAVDRTTNCIIGICSFVGFNKVNSSSFIYKRAFGNLNKEIPPLFNEVFDATFKMYDTMTLGGLTCQVVVDRIYRNQGVGTFILRNILNKYGRTPSFLWVSKDNIPAIKLYKKFDYIVVDEFEDFSDKNSKRKELKMFREGSQKVY